MFKHPKNLLLKFRTLLACSLLFVESQLCHGQDKQIRIVGNTHFLQYEPVEFQIEILDEYYKENKIDLIKANEQNMRDPELRGDPKHFTKITITDDKEISYDLYTNACHEAHALFLKTHGTDRAMRFFVDYRFSAEDQELFLKQPGLRRLEISYSYGKAKTVTVSHRFTIEEPAGDDKQFLEAWPEKYRGMLLLNYPEDFWQRAVKELTHTKDVVESRKEYAAMYELCTSYANSRYAKIMTGNLLLMSYSKHAPRKYWQNEKILAHFDLTPFEVWDFAKSRKKLETSHPNYLYGLAMMEYHRDPKRCVDYFELAFKNDKTFSRYLRWGSTYNNVKANLKGN